MKSQILLAAVVSLSMAACHVWSGEVPVAEPADLAEETNAELVLSKATPLAEAATRSEKTQPGPKAEDSEKGPEPKVGRQRVFGWKEWVWVVNPNTVLRAKLDTGARTCSIHAADIQPLEIDGKKWVKFTICDPDNKNRVNHRHKAPVVRMAKVKNDAGGLDTRYVVPLAFQLGGQKLEAEFTLNDRSHMVCEVLIGRNALRDLGSVDASRTDLVGKPKMPAEKAKMPAEKEQKPAPAQK